MARVSRKSDDIWAAGMRWVRTRVSDSVLGLGIAG